MSAPEFPLLEPAEEDALHLNRLLSVDERPFQRITRRLLAKDALIRKVPIQQATPPPDDAQVDEQGPSEEVTKISEDEWRRYHDDVLLDFAALESSLIRIQFLKRANERERDRYATEKSNILGVAETVRQNTVDLRSQLRRAQESLELKKEYDAEAEKILKDRSLKPRDVFESENEKLRAEIEDLEQENRDFDGLWRERAERFDRVVAEGKSLLRYIKGEKDEEEDIEDTPDEEGHGGQSSERKGDSSAVGTPRPDAGGATPLHAGLEGDEGVQAAQQELTQRALGQSLRVPGTEVARSPSPASVVEDTDGRDTEMVEPGLITPLDQIDAKAASEDTMDTT